jgi:phenylpyruvate tautomerase PptA (4-oxalocrotonate tautomerase family)
LALMPTMEVEYMKKSSVARMKKLLATEVSL